MGKTNLIILVAWAVLCPALLTAGTITIINPNQGKSNQGSSTAEGQRVRQNIDQVDPGGDVDAESANGLMQSIVNMVNSTGLLNQNQNSNEQMTALQNQAQMIQSIASHPVSRTMFNLATDKEFTESAKNIFESNKIKPWYISMILVFFIIYLLRAWRQVKATTFSGRLLVDFWALIAIWIMVLIVLPRYWFGPSYFTAVGRMHSVYQKSTAD